MRDLDFSLFSLSCMKLHCFPWTLLHTPLPQPHCSRRISNNRTPLCLLPCSHVHSQRDIRDLENKKRWSWNSSPALSCTYVSSSFELMRNCEVCITAIISDAIWTVQTYFLLHVIYLFFLTWDGLKSMLGQENISFHFSRQ